MWPLAVRTRLFVSTCSFARSRYYVPVSFVSVPNWQFPVINDSRRPNRNQSTSCSLFLAHLPLVGILTALACEPDLSLLFVL